MKKILITLAAMSVSGILLTGCTPNRTNVESNTDQKNSSTASSQAKSSTDSSSSSVPATTGSTNNSEDFAISLSDAIGVYKEQYPDTDITGIDISDKFGTYYYEITGVDDHTEYEVDINVTNGEFRPDREEALDSDERDGVKRRQEKLDLDNLLPLSEINAIALREADGTIEEWSLEKELSKTYWEVSLRKDSQEITVSIDAQSGNVLETEVDD